jgi:hypothetical protein
MLKFPADVFSHPAGGQDHRPFWLVLEGSTGAPVFSQVHLLETATRPAAEPAKQPTV